MIQTPIYLFSVTTRTRWLSFETPLEDEGDIREFSIPLTDFHTKALPHLTVNLKCFVVGFIYEFKLFFATKRN